MTHESMRELCVLRLYGELEPDEELRLEAHLSECSSCARFADELADGLGRLARPPRADELPPGWRRRLDRTRAPFAAPARRWPVAASFLLGGLLTWAATSGRGDSAPDLRLGSAPSGAPSDSAFRRATPPPPAEDLGLLPQLRRALRG